MKHSLLFAVAVISGLIVSNSLFSGGDEWVDLRSFNTGRNAPIALWYEDEGFFTRFNPGTDDEFTILQASVWVCADGDPGWPYPDNWHQSFPLIIYQADGDELGDELFRRDVLYEDGPAAHWITVQPNTKCTGHFFVGTIQANDFPYVEGFMMDAQVNYPDMFWTNSGGGWGRCVDRVNGFSGDLLVWCKIDRTTGIHEDGIDHTAESFSLGTVSPNPFNAVASIEVSLLRPGSVGAGIYSIDGHHILNITTKPLPAGRHNLSIDLTGSPAGVYMARFSNQEASIVRRLVLVK